jgi:hypothetical protein
MIGNVIWTVSRYVTPDVVGKLALASGLNKHRAENAISAAVPLILSELADLAATPGGVERLTTALNEQPIDVLTSIASLASIASGFAESGQVAEKGTTMLSSLLGIGPLGFLTSAVKTFAGIPEEPARIVIGLLAPLIVGLLARERRFAGLGPNGFARLLIEQRKQIVDAMPPNLGLLDTGKSLKIL